MGDLSLRALARLSSLEKELEGQYTKGVINAAEKRQLDAAIAKVSKNWRVTRIQLNWLEIFFAEFHTEPY